eukprot:CAMPEP_0185844460 /NCGR_PEP_ID=MMETSP1354-20130828/619_1 /TAXON_ID=708628 /ORGANISM="Erythrolobus madagascarensis, Strain CCMP3276" /LENGTH=143 /DNA_ID=CAMNT_0028544127 /DNA_START=9 /DNA_END=440 /DNA_ORIENTATION=+
MWREVLNRAARSLRDVAAATPAVRGGAVMQGEALVGGGGSTDLSLTHAIGGADSAWSRLQRLLEWWVLATPKRRVSHRRKRIRNSAKALKPFIAFSECTLCGSYKLPGRYCDPRDPCRRKADRINAIRAQIEKQQQDSEEIKA